MSNLNCPAFGADIEMHEQQTLALTSRWSNRLTKEPEASSAWTRFLESKGETLWAEKPGSSRDEITDTFICLDAPFWQTEHLLAGRL